jgi:Protein of unknown function (DUF992)
MNTAKSINRMVSRQGICVSNGIVRCGQVRPAIGSSRDTSIYLCHDARIGAQRRSRLQNGSRFMVKRLLVLPTIAFIGAIASQAIGQVPSGTKVGTLNCELAPSIGFIIGSHQPMRCRYTPDGPFPPEFYEGVINTIGRRSTHRWSASRRACRCLRWSER